MLDEPRLLWLPSPPERNPETSEVSSPEGMANPMFCADDPLLEPAAAVFMPMT